MKKSIFLPVLIFLPMVLLVGGCSSSQPSYGPTPSTSVPSAAPAPSSDTSDQTPTQPNGNQANTTAVTVQNFAFSPTSLTIKKGTAVTWTNRDSTPHQIASDTNAFQGPAISQDQTYSFTFNDAGIFAYHCTIHPMMKGTITVQ